MESRVEKRYNSVYSDITAITENYLSEIQNRGQALLARLDSIHKVKMTTLAQQKRELASTTICLAQVCSINFYTIIIHFKAVISVARGVKRYFMLEFFSFYGKYKLTW